MPVRHFKRAPVINADGTTDDENKDGVLRDGQRLRMSVMLMDGTVRPATKFNDAAPGYDVARFGTLDNCYEKSDRALTDAWRHAGITSAPKTPTLTQDAQGNPYGRAEHAKTNAWRSPPNAAWDR